MTQPWSPEHVVDVEFAWQLIEKQFPELVPVQVQALEVITQGKGMDRWEEVDDEGLAGRKAALQELKEQLLAYTSSEK